jgi:spore coat polysaccharide biosynthesis protein SpsF
VRAFVQARMSSARFPGKVLAPFRGRPIIDHVLAAIGRAAPGLPVVVATSDSGSDDPLAAYLRARDVACFRGPLADVLGRFRSCLDEYPCDYVLRVCADSPLLGVPVVRRVLAVLTESSDPPDLVTTTLRRTFPRGTNVELISASRLGNLDVGALDAEDREHVTRYFHRHAEEFRIVNVESGNPGLAELDVAVDTVSGLHRLEGLSASELELFGDGWVGGP